MKHIILVVEQLDDLNEDIYRQVSDDDNASGRRVRREIVEFFYSSS